MLHENNEVLEAEAIQRYARKLKLDMKQFNREIESGVHAGRSGRIFWEECGAESTVRRPSSSMASAMKGAGVRRPGFRSAQGREVLTPSPTAALGCLIRSNRI